MNYLWMYKIYQLYILIYVVIYKYNNFMNFIKSIYNIYISKKGMCSIMTIRVKKEDSIKYGCLIKDL